MNDLSTRVERLEKRLNSTYKLIKNGLKEIYFSLDDFSNSVSGGKSVLSFKFNGLLNSFAKIRLSLSTLNESEKVSVLFNGVVVEQVYMPAEGEIELKVFLALGENELLIVLENGESLNKVQGSAFGFLSEIDFNSKMEVFNFGGARIISFYNGAKRSARIDYVSNEETYQMFEVTDVDGFKFSTIGNEYLVTMEKTKGGFFVELIDLTTEQVIKKIEIESEAQSFCGTKGMEDEARFFVVERGAVKKFSFDEELNLVVSNTPYHGKEVFSSLDLENVVIVIGFDDKPKVFY